MFFHCPMIQLWYLRAHTFQHELFFFICSTVTFLWDWTLIIKVVSNVSLKWPGKFKQLRQVHKTKKCWPSQLRFLLQRKRYYEHLHKQMRTNNKIFGSHRTCFIQEVGTDKLPGTSWASFSLKGSIQPQVNNQGTSKGLRSFKVPNYKHLSLGEPYICLTLKALMKGRSRYSKNSVIKLVWSPVF